MRPVFTFILIFASCFRGGAQITSTIDSTLIGELVLEQVILIQAPIDQVWEAFTTKEGWEAWAVTKSQIDWRVGGTIKSVYGEDAEVGDSTTITNNILQIVPYKLLTLQAELSPHFPGFMKADSKRLYNTILFHAVDEKSTKVVSYGMGYRNNEKYGALMEFFIKGNEMSYQKLIEYLEK